MYDWLLLCDIMPSFHHSIAILPLPFCRSIVLCHCTDAILPFRSYHCRCAWERKCWKRLSVYIGMKWPERWLVSRLWQNDKNRIRSYLLRNSSYGATAGGNGNGTVEFFYIGNVILTALTEFLRNLHNGNGRTATEWWKPGISLCVLCKGMFYVCCWRLFTVNYYLTGSSNSK